MLTAEEATQTFSEQVLNKNGRRSSRPGVHRAAPYTTVAVFPDCKAVGAFEAVGDVTRVYGTAHLLDYKFESKVVGCPGQWLFGPHAAWVATG